jgi:hypothetical protein
MDETFTVEEASIKLASQAERGSTCPCCGQFVKAYKRRIRGNHARFLIDVARLSTAESPWVHYKACHFAGRDYAYLHHYGLAVGKPRAGLWKITELGARFLMGKAEIPEWIMIFNNSVVARAEAQIDVRTCLSSGGFDYDELMYGQGS